MRTLAPPKNPREAIASRRNPCYGFAVVADLQKYPALAALLANTRDSILKIIDPDRDHKPRPVKDPRYIKQKTFHAAVFGATPLVDMEQFQAAYKGESSAFNTETKNNMNVVLQNHLDEDKPYLLPLKCEIMPDGTVLARFAYKTIATDDEAAVLTLGKKLDPKGQFARWDTSNIQRYKTVTAAICVIDTENLAGQIAEIQRFLERTTLALQALGKIDIRSFMVIEEYNKRTLSSKHVIAYKEVEASRYGEFTVNGLLEKVAGYFPGFNRYTALASLTAIVAIGTGAYMTKSHMQNRHN